MERKKEPLFWWTAALTLFLLLAHFLPSFRFFQNPDSYLPFHTLLEFLSMSVSAMVFALGWNMRKRSENSHAILLGAGFLVVWLLDTGHTLSYAGMPDLLTPSSPEKAINFWLVARLVAGVTVLSVALFPVRSWKIGVANLFFTGAVFFSGGIFWLELWHSHWLPRTFVPGVGLTPFKIGSEYLLAILYVFTAFLFYRKSQKTRNQEILWMAVAAWTLALTELFFTLYEDVTDLFNLLGHIYKAIAHIMIYRALFVSRVQAPYEALDASHRYMKMLLDSQPHIVVINDGERMLDANQAFFQFFSEYDSLEDFLKKHRCICELFEPDDRPEYLTADLDRKEWIHRLLQNPDKLFRARIARNGLSSIFSLHVRTARTEEGIRNILTLVDITELEALQAKLREKVQKESRRRASLEEKLIEQSRLARMGELLRMISHHWRQPLNVIGLIVQNLRDEFELGSLDVRTFRKDEKTIMETIKKLSGTLQTLSSMMDQGGEETSFDASRTLRELMEIARSELETDRITYELECEDGILLKGIHNYFVQIFYHLLKNAQESLQEKDGADRRIQIGFHKVNRRVVLSVSDNGPGIDEKHFPRVFEPFFTTRSAAIKTGLGLYIVKTLVEIQYHGSIEVESLPGNTKFTVTLPAV